MSAGSSGTNPTLSANHTSVKSPEMGDTSGSLIPGKIPEWRRNDEGRAGKAPELAPLGPPASRRRPQGRGADMPVFRHFPEDVLQVEATVRRPRRGRRRRPITPTVPVAPCHAGRCGQQAPVPAADLSLRAGPHRRVSPAVSSPGDRRILRASHPGATRPQSAPGQSEAPGPMANGGSATRSRSQDTACSSM